MNILCLAQFQNEGESLFSEKTLGELLDKQLKIEKEVCI